MIVFDFTFTDTDFHLLLLNKYLRLNSDICLHKQV